MSAAKSNLRFAVTTVKSEETDDFEANDNATQCSSTAGNTIGYGTHEAVPMTVFYRNEFSQFQGNIKGKSRPTLDQLRKGFESNSPEMQVHKNHNNDITNAVISINLFVQKARYFFAGMSGHYSNVL